MRSVGILPSRGAVLRPYNFVRSMGWGWLAGRVLHYRIAGSRYFIAYD
jgi:hypothetical protein